MITILNYLFIALDSHNFEQVIQVLGEQTEKHKETIMNIAQRLQDKGRQEGFQKGQEEANITMVRNLLEQGVSIEIIMKSTGLSREKLISLQ
nr:hypothetical protein [Providencia rettgeri]ELR5072988.1 hypothetical protein [Providencia stuartii]ELR5221723.1 hypothetical protein [Providencia rettgeri]